MLIRKANAEDVIKTAKIYDAIHFAEAKGKLHTGWIKDVYPVLKTAKDAQMEGCLFVAEKDNGVIGTAIINQIQHYSYARVKW